MPDVRSTYKPVSRYKDRERGVFFSYRPPVGRQPDKVRRGLPAFQKRPTCRYNILTRPKGIFCAKIGIISIVNGVLLCYNYRWSGKSDQRFLYIFPPHLS